MDSDLISYAPLLIVFVTTGLRMCTEKPTADKPVSLRLWRELLRPPGGGKR